MGNIDTVRQVCRTCLVYLVAYCWRGLLLACIRIRRFIRSPRLRRWAWENRAFLLLIAFSIAWVLDAYGCLRCLSVGILLDTLLQQFGFSFLMLSLLGLCAAASTGLYALFSWRGVWAFYGASVGMVSTTIVLFISCMSYLWARSFA